MRKKEIAIFLHVLLATSADASSTTLRTDRTGLAGGVFTNHLNIEELLSLGTPAALKRPRVWQEETVQAGDLSATASWDGCSAGSDSKTSYWSAPPGWVIIETRLEGLSESNGSHQVSVLAKNLKIASSRTVDQAYDEVIRAAGKANDKEAKAKLIQQKSQHKSEVDNIQSSHNVVQATASAQAHGNCVWDRKRGWSEFRVMARIRYIGSDNKQELVSALMRQVGLIKDTGRR